MQDEHKMSALIAFEPTQHSEVLVDTVEHDGVGFWNPNLYIYGSSDSLHGRIGDAARSGHQLIPTSVHPCIP